MRVLVVEPEVLPYEKEINGLEEMQATVGGLIDAIYPWEDLAAIVKEMTNEEGVDIAFECSGAVPAANKALEITRRKGTVVQMPTREDIDLPVEEHLIVELYSK